MNMITKQTSLGRRFMASFLALVMVLTTFAGIGGTMAADTPGSGAVSEGPLGGVSVQQFTQDFLSNELEGDATLLGAEFTVYDKDGKEVCVIAADDAGFATTGATALPLGAYSIKQTKASDGYKLNTVWEKSFEITEDAQMVILTDGYRWTDAFDFTTNNPDDNKGVANEIIRGGLRIYTSTKDRSETGNTSDDGLGEGDADLAGAEFLIVNSSAAPVMVNGQKFQRGKAVLTIWSNEQGIAETAADALPFGRYEVYQIESPDGLYMDSRFVTTVEIREDGVIVDGNSYDGKPVQQPVYRGGFEMQKIDAILNAADVQGDASLEGAVFGVVNNSAFDVYVGGLWYKPGDVCHSFVTDANGYASVLNVVLPYGSYSIIEMAASEGYQVNKDFKIDFQIREDGKVYDLTGTAFPEYVITGDVQIIKHDLELGKSEAIGGKDHGNNEFGADLNGIVYAITNRSAKAVVVNGKSYAPGEVVGKIETHWNEELKAYTAETVNGMLPYGTYDIQEIATNESYLLTDKNVYTFKIREQGSVVSTNVDGESMIFANQIIRGDIMFEKVEDETMARMSTLWVLTNLSSGERHVLAADKNGEYLSNTKFGFAHSNQTNVNDKLLAQIDAGDVIAMADVIQGAGTWFGLGEDGSVSNVNDNLCALPYGKYNLQEVATDSNTKYHRDLKSVDFYIYRDGYVVDLGTILNGPKAPTASLTGNAIDDTTGSQIGLAGDNVTIIDTVKYDNLVAGYEYKLIGTLYSKTTGEMLRNPDGSAITVEQVFTAQSSGEIDLTFTFDGSEIAGDSVVVYLSLFDVYEDAKGNPVENKILEIADINNAKQTVVYPAIDTMLIAGLTNGHDAPAVNSLTVTDTISYENLVPGRNYTVEGVLMDAATGRDAVDADGNDIRVLANFTAEAANGTVKLDFIFDASKMSGKTLVAYEEILYRGVVVARHADMNDAMQMVSFPEIDTKASCEATANAEGVVGAEVVIEDVVSYKGLVPGAEYYLAGKLVDKATGEELPYGAGAMWTASTSEGFITLQFVIDSTDLAGKDIVVYETLTRADIVLDEHADINDVDQTVSFPAIDTSVAYADSGIREGAVSEKTVLIDTVKYDNLIAGAEYKLTGILMDKASQAPVLDAEGNTIIAETVFTPDSASGSAEVRFEFDSTELAGMTIVVAETLSRNDVALIAHADLADEDQTIRFAYVDTDLSDKEFGDDEIAADKTVTLVDALYYENLVAGAEYEVKTVLMDKETGKALAGVDAIINKFKPAEANGVFNVEFDIDTTEFGGKDIVVYETISRDGKVIIVHADIDDVDQTVTVPVATSNAVLNDTGAMDTVQYNNLHVGRNYTMISEVISADGKVLDKVVATFAPMSEQGVAKARIEFTFDCEKYAGQDLIVRETLRGQMGQTLCVSETVLSVPDNHAHKHEAVETVAPTCTDGGYTVYACKCGDTYTADETDALGHTWGEWEVTVEATVEAGGEETRICSVCGETETRATEPHVHDYELVETIAPTCTDAGYKVMACACGDTYSEPDQSATGHTWGEWKVTEAATATKPGVETRKCDNCDAIETREIPVHSHKWGSWFVTIEPTLEEPGEETRICEICGAKETCMIAPIAPHTHSYVRTDSVAATCDAAGYAVFECECGDSYSEETDAAIGHIWDDWKVAENDTRAISVTTETRTCKVCGEVETRMVETTSPPLEPHDHSHVKSDVVAPTCTAPGYTVYSCECGDSYIVTDVSATGHSYGDWVVTTEPTTESDGKQIRTCSACGKNEIQILTRLPEQDEDADVTTPTQPTEPSDDKVDDKDETKPTEPSDNKGDTAPTNPDNEDIGNGGAPDLPSGPSDETEPTDKPADDTSDNEDKYDASVKVISVLTNSAVLEIGGDVKIRSTVSYSDLKVGETYMVECTLVDKNGKVMKSAEGKDMIVFALFTPETSDGDIELTFDGFATTKLQGQKFTVNTVILLNGKTIVSEAAPVEVNIADLDTVATSKSGSKYLILDKSAVLIDKVEYFNLIPGQKYYIEGKVVNAKDGKLVLGALGKDPVVKLEFVPKTANGSIEMKFTLDTSNANGETYVVVQTLYDADGNKLAVHYDLSDKDQSVTVRTVADVQTGVMEDTVMIAVIAVMMLLMGVGFVVVSRKRTNSIR